ncbi:hypothetical protein [Streptomyces sp. NPDC000351]|uniref:hypothetical protein n=1 Tax=Streptomyces sp. NPDC000351 TaxID=3154250 RepID=UPI003332C4CA
MLFGKPYDEGYSILRSLLAEAREAGIGRISAPQYRRALGVEPDLRELLDPSSDRVLADYLCSLLASCISSTPVVLLHLSWSQGLFGV